MLAWLAYLSRSLLMTTRWHYDKNLFHSTIIGIKEAGDVIKGLSLILGDQVPSIEILIVANALSTLVSPHILACLIRSREQKVEG